MTSDEFSSILSEGIHTAFRKGTDCEQAITIYRLISQMPEGEWGNVIHWLVSSLFVVTGGKDLHVCAQEDGYGHHNRSS